jgi:hypothetical protein
MTQGPEQHSHKNRLNQKTFAVRDTKGNIYVCVPVILYKRSDPGYDEMTKYFGGELTTGEAVVLNEWCTLLPQNSSTNDIGTATDGDNKDDDDW